MACFKTFLLWMHYKLHVVFHTWPNYIMGCKYDVHALGFMGYHERGITHALSDNS
jgi:hypothetical protein